MRKETRWERNLQKRLDKQILINTNVINECNKLQSKWDALYLEADECTKNLMMAIDKTFNEPNRPVPKKIWGVR